MKSLLLFIVVLLFTFCSHPDQTADAIYFNGTIYTMATPAIVEAVAVKNGKILGVGTYGEIENYKGQNTQMIDLAGNTMTPGFIEGHAHFMGVGYNKLELDLSGVNSFEEIVRIVGEKAMTLTPANGLPAEAGIRTNGIIYPAIWFRVFPCTMNSPK
jgi:predicted amidohydrolase YtcJ